MGYNIVIHVDGKCEFSINRLQVILCRIDWDSKFEGDIISSDGYTLKIIKINYKNKEIILQLEKILNKSTIGGKIDYDRLGSNMLVAKRDVEL